MTYSNQIEDRIQFLQVDETTQRSLGRMQSVFEESIDDLLEDFYAHILKHPQLKSLFASDEVVARARGAQKRHWLDTLFSKNPGKAQFDRSEEIGLAHVRVGLTPSWYIGSYCYMLNRFIDLAAKHAAGDAEAMTETVQSLNKSVFLDMSFVVDSYLETKDLITKEMLQRASRFGEDIQRLNDEFVKTADELQERAEPLAESSKLLEARSAKAQAALERAKTAVRAAPGEGLDRKELLEALADASNHVAALLSESESTSDNSGEVLERSVDVQEQVRKLNARLAEARLSDRFRYPDLKRLRDSIPGGDGVSSERDPLSRIKSFIKKHL